MIRYCPECAKPLKEKAVPGLKGKVAIVKVCKSPICKNYNKTPR